MPTDPVARAHALLKHTPVCDGHIDLPILVREYYYNQLDKIDLRHHSKGQVDIPRLKQGRVGGFFHSVYVPCNEDTGEGYPRDNDGNFTMPSFRVRDTLEQIDVAKLIIDQYSDVSTLVS
jgi:membrane dipeptidase